MTEIDPELSARLMALHAGVVGGRKSDADLIAEAELWEEYGHDDMGQIMRDAIGSDPS